MATSSVASLSKQLSSLSKTASTAAATAKSQGKDTTGINNAINKSNAMVSQTNRQGSKSFSGSNEEKAYNANVITADSMTPTTKAVIPPLVAPTGTPDITSLNAALSNPDTGLKAESVGGFSTTPIAQAELASNAERMKQKVADMAALKLPSAVETRQQLEKTADLNNLKKQEAEYAGQIDSIQKNSQAQSLALEGQGRGQTSQFLGGEQARIQREAAIRALPVQAQLAGVQGKLQVANDYINTWGTLMMQDANNKYTQKLNTINAVYDFGTSQDKIKFDDLKTQAANKKAQEVALATAKTKAMSQALSQPGGASVISAINLATDEAGVVSALGKYNGDLLQQEAQRASINASNASTANSYAAIKDRTEQNKALLGTLDGKAQTEGQRKVQGYADRLASAGSQINDLGTQFSAKTAYGNLLPNQLQSADRQKFEQAKLNFINAKLRQESGAVIGDPEYKKADLQYFPQPGDSAGVLAQKAANRAQVISGGYREANVASPIVDSTTPLQVGSKGTTSSGLTYTIEK
jgi:hypothetical protein